jgi:hypothetical protein
MTLEEYTFDVGKLIVNLHSLEFALRAFLWNREGGSSWAFLESLREGNRVQENAFTNYDTLRQLIAKYNGFVSSPFPDLQVDPSLADLRDALAHGRLASNRPSPPLRLLKFGRPTGSCVSVTYSIVVDDIWLSEQKTRVRLELEKIMEAEQRFQTGRHAG